MGCWCQNSLHYNTVPESFSITYFFSLFASLSVFSLPTPLALIYGFPKYPLPVWILSPLSLMVILQQHGGVINLSNSVWGGGKHRYFTGNQCSTLRIRWTVNSSEAIFSSSFKHITILDKEIHVEFLKKKSHLLLFL